MQALIVPVVHRGLRDRSGDVKKRAARIVGNLCALINDPKDMAPYVPLLIPELQVGRGRRGRWRFGPWVLLLGLLTLGRGRGRVFQGLVM